jgi:hypothetical protein
MVWNISLLTFIHVQQKQLEDEVGISCFVPQAFHMLAGMRLALTYRDKDLIGALFY